MASFDNKCFKLLFCSTAALWLLLTLAPAIWAGPGAFTATVTKISDGDTIAVKIGTEKAKIRFYGIDCPETSQKYGREATATLKRLLRVGDEVIIQVRDRDRYGRLVAWVMKDGVNLNQEMVRSGAAWWYRKYCKERQPCAVLARMEDDARADGRGLWADGDPESPWEWRKENK